jgi:hypothetical protein
MFDGAQRVVWLENQMYPKLVDAFGLRKQSPFIQVGYPSSGARGRSEKIRPAEVNHQWTGNTNEDVLILIHPVYCDTPENVAKAMLFGLGKAYGGARWGAVRLGITKEDDGTLTATPAALAKIQAVIADCGEPPQGYGLPFPVREVQRARLRKYIPATPLCGKTDPTTGELLRHPIIRAASDTLAVDCRECGASYQAE